MEERNVGEILFVLIVGAGWTWMCLWVGRQIGRAQERRSHIAKLYEWMARHEGPVTIKKVEPPAPAFPPPGCSDRPACREAGFCMDDESMCNTRRS